MLTGAVSGMVHSIPLGCSGMSHDEETDTTSGAFFWAVTVSQHVWDHGSTVVAPFTVTGGFGCSDGPVVEPTGVAVKPTTPAGVTSD